MQNSFLKDTGSAKNLDSESNSMCSFAAQKPLKPHCWDLGEFSWEDLCLHVLLLYSSEDLMVLSTLQDVLLSPEDFSPSHSYIQNILPWITEATTKWLTNDSGVGRNQDIPRSSSKWQPHKSYNFSTPQESDTAHEVIKMIYQEGSSYLTHLTTAFAFNLCRGSSSMKFCTCWTTDLHH